MNQYTSVFIYVGSIVLYKRIVNTNTQNIRIANADGQGVFIQTPSPFGYSLLSKRESCLPCF